MTDQTALAMGLLIAIVVWLAIKHAIAAQRLQQQRRIAYAGATCLGRVVAIQRPFMLDDCTRLYFDFVPSGSEEPVRACHVVRSTPDESARPLPTQGSTITVRYVPERPRSAVIGKLVTG